MKFYGNHTGNRPRGAITILIIIIFLLQAGTSFPIIKKANWGISKNSIKQQLNDAEKKYLEFPILKKPSYQNKILTYILAINKDLKEKISIIQTIKKPETDYLFVDDRLYSVFENFGLIKKSGEESLLKTISQIYGKPTTQRDKDMVIYTFKNSTSKVLFISKAKGAGRECSVYYYAIDLFKIIMEK